MNRSATRPRPTEVLLEEVLDLPDDVRAEFVQALIETEAEDFGIGSSEPA